MGGPGGMGKTSLAVRAAYDCPPGLFQRIVFVSVKDREMGRKIRISKSEIRNNQNEMREGRKTRRRKRSPRFTIYRLSRTSNLFRISDFPTERFPPAQALLILDNLGDLPKTDRDQLFTFVKRLPPGCKAILERAFAFSGLSEKTALRVAC